MNSDNASNYHNIVNQIWIEDKQFSQDNFDTTFTVEDLEKLVLKMKKEKIIYLQFQGMDVYPLFFKINMEQSV